MRRRYIGATRAAALNPTAPQVEITATGWLTYDFVTDRMLEWVIVPDDDPRVDTYEWDAPPPEAKRA